MHDGSGPISALVRLAAGVLGLGFGGFGVIAAAAVAGTVGGSTSTINMVPVVSLLAIIAIGFATVFIRAAIKGHSPPWPD